jgi:hypothetical protein
MGIHCARLFSQPVLSPAACTRTCCRDRSTCTVCTSAARIRTSGTSLLAACPAGRSHTARNAKPRASPADLLAAGRAHDPISADHLSVPSELSSVHRPATLWVMTPGRGPDTQVVDISPHALQPRQVLSTQPRPPGKSFATPILTQPKLVASSGTLALSVDLRLQPEAA